MNGLRYVLLIPLVLSSFIAFSSILYVNANSNGSIQDGLSWITSFRELHEALEMANSGDQIWIAKGIYYPKDSLGREANFTIQRGVSLIGGFSGNEYLISDSNPSINRVILSGNIGDKEDSSDNCFTVVYMENPDRSNLIYGIQVSFGCANADIPFEPFDSPKLCGGGVYINAVTSDILPVIRSCIFSDNYAINNGGGIYFNGRAGLKVNPIVDSCEFRDNIASLQGGAICFYENLSGSVYITQSDFIGNSASISGAVHIFGANCDSLVFGNCNFRENEALLNSTISILSSKNSIKLVLRNDSLINNISKSQGASIYIGSTSFGDFTSCIVDSCVFYNQLEYSDALEDYITGIGLALEDDSIELNITNSNFNNTRLFMFSTAKGLANLYNTVISNCNSGSPVIEFRIRKLNLVNVNIIDNNVNTKLIKSGPNTTLINCNLSNNEVEGNYLLSARKLIIKNSIIAFNDLPVAGFIRADTLMATNIITTLPHLDSIWSWSEPGVVPPRVKQINSTKYATDPEFLDHENKDYRPRSCSPAINAGSNDAILTTGVVTDLTGYTRIVDDIVDIGPYENLNPFKFDIRNIQEITCYGNDNGVVEFVIAGRYPITLYSDAGDSLGLEVRDLIPGEYVFLLEDADNCSDTIELSFVEPSLLASELSIENISCYGDSLGSVAIETIGGIPPYTWRWSNGGIESTISGLAAGTYRVTVSDENECEKLYEIDLKQSPAINSEITVAHPTTEYSYDGNIVLNTIVGGSPPYDVTWENGTKAMVRDSLSVGTYTVFVKDSADCTKIFTAELIAKELIGDNLSIIIWPNPISQTSDLHMRIVSGETSTLEMKVFDAVGRDIGVMDAILSLHPGIQYFDYPFDLPYGVYFVQLSNGYSEKFLFKLVVVGD